MAWPARSVSARWHTIYTRMNRWSKNGVLDQVFEKLQSEQMVRIKIEAFALDSTLGQGTSGRDGRSKKNGPQAIGKSRGGWTHQGSSGCRECSNGHNLRRCRPAMRTMLPKVVPCWRNWAAHDRKTDAADHGSRLRGRRNRTTGAPAQV